MPNIPFRHPLATHAAGTVLGRRRNGSPIYAIAGGSGEGGAGSGGTPPGAPPAGNPATPPGTPPAQPPAAPPADPWANFSWDGKVESLPEPVAKVIREARAEAGKERTTAKENAAKEAREALLQEFGKQLGFIKDDEKPDPAALTAAIGEKDTRIGSLEGTVRSLTVELAAYKAAPKHEANAAALLDSRSFMESVAGLDPTASDFGEKLDAEIKKAVEANNQLRMVPGVPRRGGGDFPGGPGTTGRPTSLGQAVAASLGG